MEKKTISGQTIKELISTITSNQQKCGFEVYVITKTDPQLKKINFIENDGINLRLKLKDSILNVLNEKFNSPETEYVSSSYIADEQRKFYIIQTNEQYDPFAMLNSKPDVFNEKDIVDSFGVAFSIRIGDKQIWAYQHLWSIMVPNKSKKNFIARIISDAEGSLFEEIKNPIISFANKIDLLVIDDCIITSDYKLLQKFFGFQDYINLKADETIEVIEKKGIVSNIEKLTDYIQRGHGKTKYAKKMMRVLDSKVLKMDTDELWKNIHNSSRWNGRIKEKDGQFFLETYAQVEDLIDLLDERFTRSDITNTEYDTDVKHVADE